MSDIISRGAKDEVDRFYQRLHELTQKSNISTIAAPTSRTIDSTFSGQYFNNNIQNSNGTLTTDRFYNKSCIQANQTQSEPMSHRPSREESLHSQVSNNSVFKKPLPVKRLIHRSHIERRFDMFKDFFHSIEDKTTQKFTLTLAETLMHSIKNPPSQPVDPVVLMDHISTLVKEEYFAKRVPKSICGSSVMSDQASIDQYASGSERSVRVDLPSRCPSVRDSRVVLQDITRSILHSTQSNMPNEEQTTSEYLSLGRTGSSFNRQAEISALRERPAQTRGQNKLNILSEETLCESVFNLLNDSEIARRRDEVAAASRGESHSVLVVPKRGRKPKITPKPSEGIGCASRSTNKKSSNSRSRMPESGSGNANEDTNKNVSLLNGTTCGTSRSGRTLKPPVKYWNSKGEELSPGDIDKSFLNQSMTLRNHKVVDRTGNDSNSITPSLATKSKNKDSQLETKSKRRSATPKENEIVEKKKNSKKPAETPAVKHTAPKKKPADTPAVKKSEPKKKPADTPAVKKSEPKKKIEEDIKKQKTDKAVKKPPSKRKTKESDNLNPKKKKMEEHYESDDDDDLFGVPSYKKPQLNLKVALSPSTGLLSAKKAAGEAQGKATPPCKAIGDMMTNESIHSVMSAAKEAPKQNEAIKRVIKKMERNQTNAPTQSKAKPTDKSQSFLSKNVDAKPKFFINNPNCSAALTIIRGEVSDMEEDEDEEDQDDDLM